MDKKNAKYLTVGQFLIAVEKVWQTAHSNRYKYGDSHSIPPTSDKKISCDRLIAKALWDLGWTDQPVSTRSTSGMTIGNEDTYLTSHGFIKGNRSNIKSGSICLVMGHGGYLHTYVVNTWNTSSGIMTRFDTGSDYLINIAQPVTSSINEYTDIRAVYNIPQHKESDYFAIYNYEYYLANNPDVKEVFKGNRKDTLNHFIQYGMKEGRKSISTFNYSYYKSQYPDLEKAFGNDIKQYYIHFQEYGKQQGRKGCNDIILNKIPRFNGEVYNCNHLTVRKWAGKNFAKLTSIPYLDRGDKIEVCDSIAAENGDKWFYIRIKQSKYGFVNAKYIKQI